MPLTVEQILPENLKTEDMCSRVWQKEKECDCLWETNLSRRTSHRNRMHAKHQRESSVAKAAAAAAANATVTIGNNSSSCSEGNSANENKKTPAYDEWRSTKSYDSFDGDSDEDVFWVSRLLFILY